MSTTQSIFHYSIPEGVWPETKNLVLAIQDYKLRMLLKTHKIVRETVCKNEIIYFLEPLR